MLQICTLNERSQHVKLPMVVAHDLPFLVLLLSFGLPILALQHQALIGFPLGFACLLKGSPGEAGTGSAYCSLPVQGRLEGMLGSLCCCLVPASRLLSCLHSYHSFTHC